MYGNEIEMDSLVSVIVPIYKVECYLRKCVDSILNQTYKNLEIILVDDGSPDRCGEICDEYAKIDSRITVIHKQNGGLSDARNAGIDAAHGEYIMFVDSDDYIAETMVEKLYRALISYDAEMSLCSFLYVDEKGVPIPKMNSNRPIKNVVLSGRQAIGCLCKDKGWYYTIACCKLYNKNLWKETRFPKGKYHEDEFVSHILFGKCKRIACIEEYLYYYFQRPDSIMGKSKNSNTIKSFDVAEAFINRAVYIEKLGLNDDAGKLGQSYEDMAKSQLCNMAFFSFYEMAYYGYDNKEDEILFKKILKQNYRSLMNCEFVSKGVKVLSLLTIKMGLLSKIMIRFKDRRRNG